MEWNVFNDTDAARNSHVMKITVGRVDGIYSTNNKQQTMTSMMNNFISSYENKVSCLQVSEDSIFRINMHTVVQNKYIPGI